MWNTLLSTRRLVPISLLVYKKRSMPFGSSCLMSFIIPAPAFGSLHTELYTGGGDVRATAAAMKKSAARVKLRIITWRKEVAARTQLRGSEVRGRLNLATTTVLTNKKL